MGEVGGRNHVGDDETVANVAPGRPTSHPFAMRLRKDGAPGWLRLCVDGLGLRKKPHVSDDETVANMAPRWTPILSGLFVFFFEDEVGDGGVGGDFGLMGHACGDVDDVSGVEDGFFSAFNAGAEGFAGGGAVGVFSL